MTLSLNEMETLLKALSSLHLNDPQSPLIKNNTIAMQQYGKVSLRINMNSPANKVRNRVRSDCKYVQADLSKF